MATKILVTGGTGLIGGEIILALTNAGRRVRVIARAPDSAAARERVVARLRKSDRFSESAIAATEILAGDTAKPLFGLEPTRLREVDAIIHCAADTSFRESDSVWHTNVRGAENLVALARSEAPHARIVFVSTASVATGPTGQVVHEDDGEPCHDNTYTRSKREAESIVTNSGLDYVILRPSIVLSRGVRDRAMARSILWAIPIMSKVGRVPVERASHIDLVPVDFVARAVAQVALRKSLRHRRYHISAGDSAERFGDLIDCLSDQFPWMRRIRALGTRATAGHAMGPLASYIPFINADVRYANDRLREEIGDAAAPPPASSYLEDLFARMNMREAYSEMARP